MTFQGWQWEELSDTNEKGCDNGDFDESESFYADSDYAKDTPKQMPKALLRGFQNHPPGGRLAPMPDSDSYKKARKSNRPTSQCSTDSNFSSISGVIYGQQRQQRVNKRKPSQQQKSRTVVMKDHKIYSTFKPAGTEENSSTATCTNLGELLF